ncbi:MAG TPA: ATP-dependent Clp protease proteolytic subunit [Acidimicrobiales bacterium]|nr:ATP-dependent Clp protease proteolytic subunit [Acidimicrobiales bacterium]
MSEREQEWPWLPPAHPDAVGARAAAEPLSDALARRLGDLRVVLLHGALDDLSATRVSAELMTLDADGDDPVTLRVDCGEAALAPALTLMDVIELMGVPVHALCLGQVAGGAIGVVAVCSYRSALPSTRFALLEPPTRLEAHVRDVARWAELRAAERRRFCERVAAAARRTPAEVEHDLERGRFLSAREALTYGLVDEVGRPAQTVHRLPGAGPSPMGFGPSR